jgi:hypothetical protein
MKEFNLVGVNMRLPIDCDDFDQSLMRGMTLLVKVGSSGIVKSVA